ncbi:nitroreductase family protein [Ethanoligenens harbinense]|uniref:Nitroreductase n=1 Tax=Ethanoligenens harbinense (strain DSM 18485 / JCM 12961 / CGMCC 1.5033 / YUAN-3) TaxID=663278 RepID=E6U8R4_ETHHY|nr:nitroreductase family protein [Ethanoligenens harbinense]ADU27149.1 nitroreductase [Ethanoligenens harbinense YUAN-3]AVQ96221.1 nitroreductase [Ethanoligenens harbinense YUAN-3]AYF38881.1 nitroreductase [Ethanoligenens harbinense]AYF41631.1 nitroreductase [Ethanoligenens harbinense]QCN92462.1 nitroreductase [Ethanoligenens harbinense]
MSILYKDKAESAQTSAFWEAVKSRRTIYSIGKEEIVSAEQVEQIVKDAVLHVPSAFNSQSARVVLLFGAQSDQLWELAKKTLKAIVPSANFPDTEAKLNGFQAGYGTVLFFEDQNVVKGLQEQFALYKDNFPIWSLQSSGMLQFAVWTALEEAGLGVNLQHYNPLIDEQVKAAWSIPENWKLLSEMPFGKPLVAAGEKDFSPIEDRVKIFR